MRRTLIGVTVSSGTQPAAELPWSNTFRVEGDLRDAVRQLEEKTPRGLLVGGTRLSAALALVSTKRLKPGVMALHYRCKDG